MSYVDTLREIIYIDLQKCDEGLDWTDAHGPEIIRQVVKAFLAHESGFPWIPESNPLADHFVSLLHDGVAESRKVIAELKKLNAYLGSPDALNAAADTIGTSVGTPAVTLSQRMVAGNLDTTNSSKWDDGSASATYVQKFDGRDAATKQIEELASPLATGLHSMADAIQHFYIDVLGLAASAVVTIGGIVAAIAGLPAGGVGAIPGLIVALLGLVGLGISVGDLIVSFKLTMDDVTDSFSGVADAWPAVLH